MLVITQGTTETFSWNISDPVTGLPRTIDGWTVRGQVRETYASATVLHEWSGTIGNATTSGSKVEITVSPATSSAWDWRTGVFDIELTNPSGDVARIAEGRIVVRPEVTR